MRKTLTPPPNWLAWAVVTAAMASWTQGVSAQESMLGGLGWHKNSAGTEMDSSSQVRVQGNTSQGPVTSSGGKGSALANIGMSVDLAGTAQANGIGISSMSVRSTQLQVLNNQVTGLVNALGGAATANMVLTASGSGRKPLSSSRLTVMNNQASQIDAFGAKSSVLLGTGSLQLPGRATANSVLLDATEVHDSQTTLTRNQADGIVSMGGAALANALTGAQSQLRNTQIQSSGNRATDIRAGGGSSGLGRGMLAQVDLTGVAAANTVAVTSSGLAGARLSLSDNTASQLTSTGGSALANSISFTEHQLTGGAGYTAHLRSNTATNVQAFGGEGSILGGALADVRMSASALANAISVQKGQLAQAPTHSLANNRAVDVVATGGAASANSIWIDEATVNGGSIQLDGNRSEQVRTTGASGSIGAGIVASVDRNGRALSNSVAIDRQSTLDQSTLYLQSNEGRGITGTGGFASANSATVSEGRIQKSTVTFLNNRAQQVQSTGYAAQAGGGLLYSAGQQSAALANALAVTGSQMDAKSLTFTGNQATNLAARGGILMANSISLEDGGGASSQLSASGTLVNNTASDLSSAAKSSSAVAGLARSDSRARAAANALVLHDDARIDESSNWLIGLNDARQVHVDGGTALVNALAAYRGARIHASPVTILNNRGDDIRATGGSSQVAGVGSNSNGVLAANSLYLDGSEPNRLTDTPLQIVSNTARQLNAQGGRINANSVSINGRGSIENSTASLIGNTAGGLHSEGTEGTVAGFAAFGRGVGQANANTVQVLSAMRRASLQLIGNTANSVSATEGLASANSITQGDEGRLERLTATLATNTAEQTRADGGRTALVNSIHAEGEMTNLSVQMTGNQGSAQASSEDGIINSVRTRKRARISDSSVNMAVNRGRADAGTANSVDVKDSLRGSQITVLGNQGTASRGGVINSVIGEGQISGGNITILGNSGSADKGTANSVAVSGNIAGSQLALLNNRGNVSGGGTVNSITGNGPIRSSQISIIDNTGSTSQGGTVNSVKNSGSITGARIALIGNEGRASGGGLVNSVDNRGQLSGQVLISANRGTATMGGTVNSLVNRGVMSGNVVISGNEGRSMSGGTSNSVINHGVITGKVAIVGNRTAAAAGITSGSVRNMGGAIVGSAGVAGNAAYASNPGYTYSTPSMGVVNNSVTVVPAFNVISN
ncbi:beta strand repeat-containing protein [Ottowia thiooxydans]|uniref:beta strand repeat-containing protein n=1 Tax=Ottowia thiooxydans TaxID=219182 RepID=UPI00042343DB|nr:hypothetical protein [Ottowia thiooxydans]